MSENPAPSPVSKPDAPLEEDIARLAYSYYEEEGRPEGFAGEHWLRAERNLRGIPPWTIENGAGDA